MPYQMMLMNLKVQNLKDLRNILLHQYGAKAGEHVHHGNSRKHIFLELFDRSESPCILNSRKVDNQLHKTSVSHSSVILHFVIICFV